MTDKQMLTWAIFIFLTVIIILLVLGGLYAPAALTIVGKVIVWLFLGSLLFTFSKLTADGIIERWEKKNDE